MIGKLFATRVDLGFQVFNGCDSVEESGKPYRIVIVRPSGTYQVTVEKLKPPRPSGIEVNGSSGWVGFPKEIGFLDEEGSVDWDKMKKVL